MKVKRKDSKNNTYNVNTEDKVIDIRYLNESNYKFFIKTYPDYTYNVCCLNLSNLKLKKIPFKFGIIKKSFNKNYQ